MNYLYNAIRTPDGTLLESWDESSVSHTDIKDGKTYVISGGHEYLSRNIEGFTELSLELSIFAEEVKQVVKSLTELSKRIVDFKIVTGKSVTHKYANVDELTSNEIVRILQQHYCAYFESYCGDVQIKWTETESDIDLAKRVELQKETLHNLCVDRYNLRLSIFELINKLRK